MITVSLNEIRKHTPCEDGWAKVLKAKGGTKADMNAQFPLADIMESNDFDDAMWCLRCRPEYASLWRKYAVWCARQGEHLRDGSRIKNALDVAWRHSNGEATDAELSTAWAAARAAARDAARDAAWAAAWAAARDAARDAAWAAAWAAARGTARDAAWAAARDAQKTKLIEILTAGEWVD